MHGENILVDIGVALLAATVLAYIARALRQPLILAYIGAGLLIGPSGLGLLHNEKVIAELSELGLAFLLFIVGLEIDLKKLAHSGRVVTVVGAVQVIASAAIAMMAMWLLGYGGMSALYLGVASAFSSTMIVVKLLSDKSELDTVDGRLTLGILLVQDVLAIVVLALQPNLGQPSVLPLLVSLLRGLGLIAGALLAARYALTPLLRFVAKSPEVVLISAISWCLVVSYFATLANFSIAMGALIAGVTLSALPYTLDVVAKIRSLRDFFVTLFFVSLGLQLQIGSIGVILAALFLSGVVIATRFVTAGPLIHSMGYGPRVAILSSIALSQAGEFGLVIVSLGQALGHIGPQVVSIVALTMVITATLSTYMMMVNHTLAQRFAEMLRQLGLVEPPAGPVDEGEHHHRADVLLLGFHRVASSLVQDTSPGADGYPFLIVDFSPEVYEKLRQLGVPVLYGDISHLDTLEHVGVEEARVVVSTVSEDFLRGTDNLALLKQIRRLNPAARVILSAETLERANEMYAAGADYVVLPRIETARAFAEILAALRRGEIDALRLRALADLKQRDEVLA